MKAEIISVGTEILLGEITDTNSIYLSQLFAQLGIDVHHQSTVGDNEASIIETLMHGSERSDLIVTIGGLGPTEDDITKSSLAKFLETQLTIDQPALEKIKKYFEDQHRPLTKNNERQAWTIDGAITIANPNGLAVGLFYRGNGTDYLVLPGPPSEFKPMVDTNVKALLAQQYQLKQTIQSKTLHFVGIGEADLASRIDDIIQRQTNPTIALYFKPTDVTIRLTAKADSLQDANKLLNETQKLILEQVGEYFYAEGEKITFPEFVIEKLVERKLSITAAESLTGGEFQSTVVQTPGSSQIFEGGFVTYANEIKSQLVGVKEETIQKHSVVSAEVASEMALGAKERIGTDLAVSFTGVAGPVVLEGHEPGDVWIGLALPDGKVVTCEFHFSGDRQKIRHLSVMNGFKMIWENSIK